jgi:hypothetical protein
MIVQVQYHYITWNPPHLTEAEELELGRQIALVGREHFVSEFRKSIGKSAAQAYQSRQNDSTPARENASSSPLRRAVKAVYNGLQWVGLILLIVMVVTGLVLMTGRDWGQMFARIIPLIIIVLGILLLSVYLATRKFERWVDHLVARYAAHVARKGI